MHSFILGALHTTRGTIPSQRLYQKAPAIVVGTATGTCGPEGQTQPCITFG
ncbi:MAG: hypothetical protein WBZ36_29665 [Candidatus Nitrosopolaris sp.]